MADREDRGYSAARGVAANDNPGSGSPGSGPGSGPGQAGAGGGPEARIGAAVMTLARLLGRRIARERFEALEAANDNAPARDAGEG